MDYQKLKEEVRHHDYMYHVECKPEISDAEYDELYRQLELCEKQQGYRDFDSPTVKVVGIDHREGRVEHPNKLYSLKKVYNPAEVDSQFTVEIPKIDGASLAIHTTGDTTIFLSRGDGEYGENITPLFSKYLEKYGKDFKELGSNHGLLTIRCEAITFQKVENYRNYVAGALNLKDQSEFDNRQIELVVHDVITEKKKLDYIDRLNLVSSFMKTVYHNKEELKKIPQDGKVYRTNSWQVENQLGYTSKYPRFAVALKERATVTAATILKDIIWQIGRTGVVTPTGIVDPVLINEATVSRLTLHNLAFIEENAIRIGDKIEIERAGEIIPTYVRTLERSPVGIEVTQQNAEEGIGAQVVRIGPKLFVADKSVNDERAILHFASCMNIQGLGPASIKKMGLTHISDLYRPQKWDILGANGAKILQEIEYSKTKPYENVLTGLGIPNVGASLARKIIQSLPKFENLDQIEFTKIDKVGPKITEKILVWFEENKDWVLRLPVQLEQKALQIVQLKPICITGTLDRTRKEMASLLLEKGFEVKSSVTKQTYALITDGQIDSDKVKTAQKYGVKIVNYFDNKQQVLEGIF